MGSMVLNRLLLMMMINCICEMVVQRKSVKLIGLLWEALFFANLRHAPRRTWTCAEPEFRYVRDRLQISLLLWSEFKWIINFYFLKIIRKPQKTYGFLMISGGIKLIRLIIEAKFGDDFIDLLNDIVVVITVVVIATTPQCCKINIAQPFQVGY